MKIKLLPSLHPELQIIGLKAGDEIKVDSMSPTTGACYFTHYRNDVNQNCVVWPEDYEVIETATELSFNKYQCNTRPDPSEDGSEAFLPLKN